MWRSGNQSTDPSHQGPLSSSTSAGPRATPTWTDFSEGVENSELNSTTPAFVQVRVSSFF